MVLVKVIATDLDGTLLGADGELSERSRSALVAAEAAGVQVVFVTGRPLRWMTSLFDHVGSHGVAILSNGALVWDVATARPLAVSAITRADALRASADLRRAVPGTAFAFESLEGIAVEAGFVGEHRVPRGARQGRLAEICGDQTLKLLAVHSELDPADFWRRALEVIGDQLEITWSSKGALLEMSARGVTKASALASWCASHGAAPEDVVAFGDMPNDIGMLEWAGTSYAVANAHPTVLAAARHTTESNEDDGVAQVIERLLEV